MPQDLEDDVDLSELVPDTSRVPGRRRTSVSTTAPAPTSTVSARPSTGTSFLAVGDGSWTWVELRDYVLANAKTTHGQHIQRDPILEKSIFSAFLKRHGEKAPAIARYAFETSAHPGYWMGAPIRPSRFTKGADAVFAEKILEHLS